MNRLDFYLQYTVYIYVQYMYTVKPNYNEVLGEGKIALVYSIDIWLICC